MRERIEELLKEIHLDKLSVEKELEAYRIKYLGKKGVLSELFEGFKSLEASQKKEIGSKLNELKNAIQARIDAATAQIQAQKAEVEHSNLDLSRPTEFIQGHRHPLSLVREKIIDIFEKMGFVIWDGPEIEDDWHLFTALNFPKEHPARDMQDTFFVEKRNDGNDIALRTHTSSVQIRMMESQKPPIRAIFPGRVYRNEAISARAHCFFHQVEGLYIDKNVSFVDLRSCLLQFAKEMFGEKTKIRLRPSYFPFTEPSAEMDIECNICEGKGCPFCKHTGWVEILGCGMVDPNVLKACNIDPNVYSGFAFGMGIERETNLKYKINDLRLFSENDQRFLEQF